MILLPREISVAPQSSEGSPVRQDGLCWVKKLEVQLKMGALTCKELNTPRFCWSWQNFMGCSILRYWLTGCKEKSSDISGFILDVEIHPYEDQHLKIRNWEWHGAVDLFCMVSRDIVFMSVSHITVKPHVLLAYSKPKQKTYSSMFFGSSHYWYILQA